MFTINLEDVVYFLGTIIDNGSANAEAPLTVVNTSGFDLPQTGDHGTWMYSAGGLLLMAISAAAIFVIARRKSIR